MVVGGAVLAAGILLVVIVGPPAVEQAAEFEEDLPEMTQGFYDLPVVGSVLEDNDVATRIEDYIGRKLVDPGDPGVPGDEVYFRANSGTAKLYGGEIGAYRIGDLVELFDRPDRRPHGGGPRSRRRLELPLLRRRGDRGGGPRSPDRGREHGLRPRRDARPADPRRRRDRPAPA